MANSDSSKLNVLFVCLGNICRSPMAEGVFRSLTAANPRIGTVDSAGTGAYHTLDPPDSRTMDTLYKKGIRDYEHGARQVRKDDFDNFDYIFAMDRWNLQDLQKTKRRIEGKNGEKKTKAQVMLFGEFASSEADGSKKGSQQAEEVADPYYGADNGFDIVYEQVRRFSKNFLADVVDKEE